MGLFFTRYKTRLSLGEKEFKNTLKRRVYWLMGVAALHAGLFFLFEDVTLFQAIWVTFITLSTVGYGDISATTIPGQISTVVLCVFTGIAILASVFDAYSGWRDEARELKRTGRYNWNLDGHILIANFPKDYSVSQMVRLIKAIRSQKAFAEKPIQIITTRFNGDPLPQDIVDLGNIAHVHGKPSSPEALDLATVDHASHVIILRDRDDNDPEGYSFNICSRIRDANRTAVVTVQVKNPFCRAARRLYRAGANNLMRPVRAYPEIIALTMLTKGVDDLFDDLFSIDGNEFRLIPYKGRINWAKASRAISESNKGLPIGIYHTTANREGKVFCQPTLAPDWAFKGDVQGVYILSRKNGSSSLTDEEWRTIIGGEPAPLTVADEYCSHLTVLNLPVNQACTMEYLNTLVDQLHKTQKYSRAQITIVAEEIPEGAYEWLEAMQHDHPGDSSWNRLSLVRDVPGDYLLDAIESGRTKTQFDDRSVVAILSNDSDSDPDGYTFELIDLLRHEAEYNGLVVAECENDNERQRLYKAGANHCLRPVRAYPGMLVRTLANPGVEKAVEAFFKINDIRIRRVPLKSLPGAGESMSFGDIIHGCRAMQDVMIPVSTRCDNFYEENICPDLHSKFKKSACEAMVISKV